jgi:hypothetical protein
VKVNFSMGGNGLFIFPAFGFMINLALVWVIPTAASARYLGVEYSPSSSVPNSL